MHIKKIVILSSSISSRTKEDEKDSEIQAIEVRDELLSWGIDVDIIPFTLNMSKILKSLKEARPDLVFNLVESIHGQGRLIHLAPTLLDVAGIPYSGADTNATFLTSNKLTGKSRFIATGIPTPPFFSMNDLKKDSPIIDGQYIVKSVWEHASIGLGQDSIINVKNSFELMQRMSELQPRLGGECFAEGYIEGREFNLSIIAGPNGPNVLPPAEICFTSNFSGRFKIVDYVDKWSPDSITNNMVRNFEFPEHDAPLLEQLRAIALSCWNIFELRGYARIDFRVDAAGRPFVLEVNTNPCLSKDAGFIAACQQGGIQYRDALRRILQDIPHYRNMNASRPSIFPDRNSSTI